MSVNAFLKSSLVSVFIVERSLSSTSMLLYYVHKSVGIYESLDTKIPFIYTYILLYTLIRQIMAEKGACPSSNLSTVLIQSGVEYS